MKRQAKQQNRRGAALVEMALVLPIFIAVVLGIIEFGRGMMVGQLMTNAAREGARWAIIDGTTNAEVTQAVSDFLTTSVNVASADVSVAITITPGLGNPSPGNLLVNSQTGDLVTVLVQVPFDKVSYIAGNHLAGKNLSAQATMRHE